MLTVPPLSTIVTFGTFFVALGLVIYRLLWAGASLAGAKAGMWPKSLQKLQRWLHGEPAYKKAD
jgi:hypothetical protein